MVRKREGKQLDAWIKAVLESGIPELNSFVWHPQRQRCCGGWPNAGLQ